MSFCNSEPISTSIASFSGSVPTPSTVWTVRVRRISSTRGGVMDVLLRRKNFQAPFFKRRKIPVPRHERCERVEIVHCSEAGRDVRTIGAFVEHQVREITEAARSL